jgi:hypothetical protein
MDAKACNAAKRMFPFVQLSRCKPPACSMLELILASPISLLLVSVTVGIHGDALLWVHSKFRKARAEACKDTGENSNSGRDWSPPHPDWPFSPPSMEPFVKQIE